VLRRPNFLMLFFISAHICAAYSSDEWGMKCEPHLIPFRLLTHADRRLSFRHRTIKKVAQALLPVLSPGPETSKKGYRLCVEHNGLRFGALSPCKFRMGRTTK